MRIQLSSIVIERLNRVVFGPRYIYLNKVDLPKEARGHVGMIGGVFLHLDSNKENKLEFRMLENLLLFLTFVQYVGKGALPSLILVNLHVKRSSPPYLA